MFDMFEASGIFPDSERWENMNPFMKWWLFEGWVAKQEREIERDRRNGIFVGSFYNPEAAQKMLKVDRPDFQSTEDDFERSVQEVRKNILEQENAGSRRKRRRRKRKVVRDAR